MTNILSFVIQQGKVKFLRKNRSLSCCQGLVILDSSGQDQSWKFQENKYIFDLEPTCWQDFHMILNHFVWRGSKTISNN